MRDLIIKMASQDPSFRRDLILKLAAGRPKSNHKPGDVWKTQSGFRAMNIKGVAKTFKSQDQAKTFSKGSGEKTESFGKRTKKFDERNKQKGDWVKEFSLLDDKQKPGKKEVSDSKEDKSKSDEGQEAKKTKGDKKQKAKGRPSKKGPKKHLSIHGESQTEKWNKAKPRKWEEATPTDTKEYMKNKKK